MRSKEKVATYQDLVVISEGENNEPLIDVRKYDATIVVSYEKKDMLPYLGDKIFVRSTVAERLAAANKNLKKLGKFNLKIVYGYRHPEVQKAYFEKRRAELLVVNPLMSSEGIDTQAHQFVASPMVAGHPTGGAIDVTIISKEGISLDMGTKIADFSDPVKIRTFADSLTQIQKENRLLLKDILIKVGFAPFYGEWWHFSYGDREWAFFYGEKASLYKSIDFRVKK